MNFISEPILWLGAKVSLIANQIPSVGPQADEGAVDLSPVSDYIGTWITSIIAGISGLAAVWFTINTIIILIRAQNYNRKGEPERRAEALSGLWWNIILFVGLGIVSAVSGILAGVVFS